MSDNKCGEVEKMDVDRIYKGQSEITLFFY